MILISLYLQNVTGFAPAQPPQGLHGIYRPLRWVWAGWLSRPAMGGGVRTNLRNPTPTHRRFSPAGSPMRTWQFPWSGRCDTRHKSEYRIPS